jgi:hypothetical protein
VNGALEYQVDEAMLGSSWNGGEEALRAFCELLQGVVGEGVKIVAVTDHNGAQNRDPSLVSDKQWQDALADTQEGWWVF